MNTERSSSPRESVPDTDIARRRETERLQALSGEVLNILNDRQELPQAVRRILEAIKKATGFDAVGIRLREGEDFPYAAAEGFSEAFIQAENSLVTRGPEGGFCKDEQGNPLLECTCGVVLSGRTDPSQAFFTTGGSAWFNQTAELLHLPADQELRLNPRNRCIHEGFASVALIPIRVGQRILGLLQLNDRRPGRFTLETIRFIEGLAASFGVALTRLEEHRALRASEERHRALLENSEDAILLTVPTGEILAANPAACRMFGYSEEELCRIGRQALMDPADTRWGIGLAHRESTGRFCGELSFVRKNGERVETEVTSRVYHDPDGAPRTSLIIRDITERKRAEGVIRRLAAIVESSDDAIIGKDLDGTITSWNHGAETLYGYRAEEAMGRPISLIIPPPRRSEMADFLAVIRSGKHIQHFETVRVKKDGTEIQVSLTISPISNSSGQIIGASTTARDITERKQAELRLLQNEAELQAIYDGTPIMMCLVNERRDVERMNQAMRDFMAGGGAEGCQTPVGGNLGCLGALDNPAGCGFGPECRACALRMSILETFKTGKAFRQVECQKLVAHAGRSRELLLSVSTALVRTRGQSNVLVCLEDITGRKRLEAQFLQAQKMEAVGHLAGGVAHDFNNILAAMLMQLGLLQQTAELVGDTRQALKDMEMEARRAAMLTRQLLMFSRRSVLDAKVLDLNALIEDLLKMLRRLIGEHIELGFHGQADLPSLRADAGMLEQVLMNLTVNARDAMPGGGRITIATESIEVTEEQVQLMQGAKLGRFICLSVADTGCGMDETTLKRIFEPFFTTKPAGKGTGLGLATVYGIVSQHQGWVDVESKLGQGTRFRLFFPSVGAAVDARPVEVSQEILRGHETILLVEDEEKVRRSLARSLRVLGYGVFEASTGPEAIAIWQQRQKEIEVVFSDMVMPGGMSGLDLVSRLRIQKPELKAIISSGYSAEMVKGSNLSEDGIVYLPKPYHLAELAKVLRSCLDRQELGSQFAK